MKFIVQLLLLLVLVSGISYGQENKEPGYLRFPTLPPFTVLTLDSTNFTRDNLKRNTETIIMYFNPGCDHCRHQTDSIISHIDRFKKVEILMTTWQPLEELKTFNKEFKLKSYPNIHVGRDSKYFFQPFYKIMNLPFMALYDRKGKLLTTFEGTTPVKQLLDAFNKK